MDGFAQAVNYGSRYGSRPRLIVIHTMECPCQNGRAQWCAQWFAGTTAPVASAHWMVDPSFTWGGVDESYAAWAAPGANSDGIQIEQAGYAAFTPDDWASADVVQMINTQTGPLVAAICARWGIPVRWLTNEELAAGASGIVEHRQVSEVYQRSDHSDCGLNYPHDLLIAAALGTPVTGNGAGGGGIIPGGNDLQPDERIWLDPSTANDGTAKTLYEAVHQTVEAELTKWLNPGGVYSGQFHTMYEAIDGMVAYRADQSNVPVVNAIGELRAAVEAGTAQSRLVSDQLNGIAESLRGIAGALKGLTVTAGTAPAIDAGALATALLDGAAARLAGTSTRVAPPSAT